MEKGIFVKGNGTINVILSKKNPKVKQDFSNITSKEKLTNHQVHEPLKKMEKELDELIGLNSIKGMMKEIYAFLYINKKRQEQNLKVEKQVLHMMFKGNPGTGKTTIARIIGKLFCDMNVLSKGHIIEVERADLVGEYIGHTAIKTRSLIKKSMGGILFIDEAYSLGRGGEKDFGKEAIDTLVAHMENKQHDFILIMAGYSKEMDRFLRLNPGLRSRFPFIVEFADYKMDELMQIASKMCEERQYKLTAEAEVKLRDHLLIKVDHDAEINFSNGRYIRNIIERAVRKQAMRLLYEPNPTKEELMSISRFDLDFNDVLK